jgi:Uma2 family endonuclease
MTTTVKPAVKVTFEEYLAYDDGMETRYELVDGELLAMSLGSGEHGEIADVICDRFKFENKRLGLNLAAKTMLIGVQSPRGNRWETSRIPDVVVIPLEQWRSLQNREAVILLNEPAPLLVVEVVSESTKAADYHAKRLEYRLLGIAEYWIADPLTLKVSICILEGETYQVTEYQNEQVIWSQLFPELTLTAAGILNPTI